MTTLIDAPVFAFCYVVMSARISESTGEVVDNSARQLRTMRELAGSEATDRPWCVAADCFYLIAKHDFDLALGNAGGRNYKRWKALCLMPESPDLVMRTTLNVQRLSCRFCLVNFDVIADDGRKWRYRNGELTEDITPTGAAIQRTPEEVPVSITIRRKHAPDEEP